ncbi:hypothetical protein N9L68_09390 [bacterium]|nr:hypothetical protein [bacterium]
MKAVNQERRQRSASPLIQCKDEQWLPSGEHVYYKQAQEPSEEGETTSEEDHEDDVDKRRRRKTGKIADPKGGGARSCIARRAKTTRRAPARERHRKRWVCNTSPSKPTPRSSLCQGPSQGHGGQPRRRQPRHHGTRYVRQRPRRQPQGRRPSPRANPPTLGILLVELQRLGNQTVRRQPPQRKTTLGNRGLPMEDGGTDGAGVTHPMLPAARPEPTSDLRAELPLKALPLLFCNAMFQWPKTRLYGFLWQTDHSN